MITVGETRKFVAYPRTNFCRDHLRHRASCVVLKVNSNTATVRFDGADDTDIVSLTYLKK